MSGSPDNRRRSYWLKTLHEWHWVSSALCLIGLLLFGITGFTLNHAGQIEAKPVVASQRGSVQAPLLIRLQGQVALIKQEHKGRAALPDELQAWVRQQWSVDTAARDAEWTDDEIYLQLKGTMEQHGIAAASTVETTYSATICMLAAQGTGVGVVNPYIASVFAQQLRSLPLLPRCPVEVVLAFAPQSAPSTMAEHFATLLQNHFQDLPGGAG